MQVIDAVRQIRHIELHRAAFGFLLPQQSALTIIKAKIIVFMTTCIFS
jgi:hypothetical protein